MQNYKRGDILKTLRIDHFLENIDGLLAVFKELRILKFDLGLTLYDSKVISFIATFSHLFVKNFSYDSSYYFSFLHNLQIFYDAMPNSALFLKFEGRFLDLLAYFYNFRMGQRAKHYLASTRMLPSPQATFEHSRKNPYWKPCPHEFPHFFSVERDGNKYTYTVRITEEDQIQYERESIVIQHHLDVLDTDVRMLVELVNHLSKEYETPEYEGDFFPYFLCISSQNLYRTNFISVACSESFVHGDQTLIKFLAAVFPGFADAVLASSSHDFCTNANAAIDRVVGHFSSVFILRGNKYYKEQELCTSDFYK